MKILPDSWSWPSWWPSWRRKNVEKDSKPEKNEEEKKDRKKIRRTELPLYVDAPCTVCVEKKPGIFAHTVQCMKQEFDSIVKEVNHARGELRKYKHEAEDKLDDISRTLWAQDDRLKYAFVSAFGFLGFAYGRQRSLKRRLVQGAFTSLIGATIAFPVEMHQLLRENAKIANEKLIRVKNENEETKNDV